MPNLHRFAIRGNIPTVAHYIETKVDLNETYQGQTVLDQPSLRDDIVAMLKQAGAIAGTDIKLLAHSLGLPGTLYLHGKEKKYPIAYEGIDQERVFPVMARHLRLFLQSAQTNQELAFFNDQEQSALAIVTQVFENYVTSNTDANCSSQYFQGYPVIVSCRWPAHTGFTLLHKNRLYIANEGGNTLIPSVSCYQIDQSYLRRLMPEEFATLIAQISEQRSYLFSSNLSLPGFKPLKPQLLYYKRISRQKIRNCSYSNVKRGVEVILRALSDDDGLAWTKEMNIPKICKEFSIFEKKRSIDEYIEKYQQSPNEQVLEPLLCYLREKVGLSEGSRHLGAYIIEKVNTAFNLNNAQIISRLNQLEHHHQFIWKLFTLFGRVEDLLFETGYRKQNLKKIASYVPCIWHRQSKQALSSCQIQTHSMQSQKPQRGVYIP